MDRLTTNIIPPDGPLDAKICGLGEAPGKEEDFKLMVFKGEAGKLLNRCLRAAGLSRTEILLYNIFEQRPPNNKINYYFVDKSNTQPTWEGQEHIDRLQRWLQNLLTVREQGGGGPNVIVAFGAVPMNVLTGKRRITKWRGTVLPCTLVEGFKVYPTFHPSYINRLMNETREQLVGEKKKQQQNALPIFLRDLDRIVEQSESPTFTPPKRDFTIVSTAEEAISLLNSLHDCHEVAVDIETLPSSSGPVVWCIGFSSSPSEAFCIPLIKDRRLCWSINEETRIWKTISEVFLNGNIQKIFQGGLYDTSVLGRYYGLRCANRTYQDTMLCHHASHPYLRKGLDLLASIYTWEPYYKDDGKVWSGKRISDQAEFIYNCRDCAVTREIFPIVKRDAKELNTWSGYERTMSVLPSVLAMQLRGVKIDLEKKEVLTQDFTAKAKQNETKLNELAEGTYNVNSPAQISKLLYGVLGLDIQYSHKTKRPTTDVDAINRLLKKHPKQETKEYKILKTISSFRKYSKLASTYAKMKVDSDGRIHTSYSWISTYRLNSSESPFGGGGNLQNIPVKDEEGRAIRELFIPDDGLVMLAGDQAQAESREVAWLAEDIRLIEAYLAGIDIHWERAKEIFGIPDSVPYHPKALFKDKFTGESHTLYFYRQIAKTIVHAFNYKMGPIMLQNILLREGVYFPTVICKQLIQSTKVNNPLTVRWQNTITEEIRATRTLITPLGRKRIFRGRLNDELFRSAIAFGPQSTVGELTQLAIQEIHSKDSTFECLLNSHDEVLGQCPKEDIPKSMKLIKKAMEIPHMVGGRELIIPCEFKWGYNWGQMEEIK